MFCERVFTYSNITLLTNKPDTYNNTAKKSTGDEREQHAPSLSNLVLTKKRRKHD